jgi:hypothetical protein
MKRSVFLMLLSLLCITSLRSQPQWDTLGFFKKDGVNSGATIPVLQKKSNGLIVFKSDFDVDPDGSPRAYNEENTGLLHNDNGRNKTTGKWFAVVTADAAGKIPVKQSETDPFPGFYISTTSLQLINRRAADVKRYIDPDSVSFYVLPGGNNGFRRMGIKLGDVGFVYNRKTNKWSWAVFADSGPAAVTGEGSMKLAGNIGVPIRIDARGRIRGGMDEAGIVYISFPNSGLGSYAQLNDDIIKDLCLKAIRRLNMSIDDLKAISMQQ